jgi:hypothetical protein
MALKSLAEGICSLVDISPQVSPILPHSPLLIRSHVDNGTGDSDIEPRNEDSRGRRGKQAVC